MLKRLWSDDCGAIISTEWVLLTGVTTFGVVPGMVALRNGINDGYNGAVQGLMAPMQSSMKGNGAILQQQVNQQVVHVSIGDPRP